jgi:hypothetical protein
MWAKWIDVVSHQGGVYVILVGINQDLVSGVLWRDVPAEAPVVKKLVKVVEFTLLIAKVGDAVARYVCFDRRWCRRWGKKCGFTSCL